MSVYSSESLHVVLTTQVFPRVLQMRSKLTGKGKVPPNVSISFHFDYCKAFKQIPVTELG